MAREVPEGNFNEGVIDSNSNSGKAKEKLREVGERAKSHKKLLKRVGGGVLAALLVGGAAKVDIKRAENRKNEDIELSGGEIKVKTGNTVEIVPSPDIDGGPDPINTTLGDILDHNCDIVNVDVTTLESIMLGENSLKTAKNFLGIIDFQKLDSFLESKGIDRNSNSESSIGKIMGKLKEGSYGPYQVQPEAIDKYKEDTELCDDLCRKIATFKLPDCNGEYVPLCKQLGLTVEEMMEKIKNHEIYTFAGGNRFLVAYGIVLIDQIFRDVESLVESYNKEIGYDRWSKNTKIAEQNHRELVGGDKNMMNPFILSDSGNVSYQKIGNLFNSDAFKKGMAAAYWCMDYVKNINNSNYLFMLNLLELNKRFESGGKGSLDAVTPTGNFGPSTLKLVNKHFNQNFKTPEDAKKFMDNMSQEELKDITAKAFDKFEQNMRLLYTLNAEDKHGINELQSSYLSECLDITFNNMYAAVVIFYDFIKENCGDNNDILSEIDTLRNSFVQDQNKESLARIKKIMTDEANFIDLIKNSRLGDGESPKKLYLKRIKFYLGPTLIGATDWVYQTGGIIPVIQDHNEGEGKRYEEGLVNESNSIHRFDIGVAQEQMAQAERERGEKYILQPGEEYNMDSLKHIMWNKKSVKDYLVEQCRTIDGDPITSPQMIPDELVIEMLRGIEGERIFENGEWFYEGDTIYIKYIGLDSVYHEIIIDKPATKHVVVKKTTKKKGKKKTVTEDKIKELCSVNSNGVLEMKEGGSFQEILYIYSQTDNQIRKMLESIAGNLIAEQSDVNQDIIKKVIRHPDGREWKNINNVNVGDKFIIVMTLN